MGGPRLTTRAKLKTDTRRGLSRGVGLRGFESHPPHHSGNPRENRASGESGFYIPKWEERVWRKHR